MFKKIGLMARQYNNTNELAHTLHLVIQYLTALKRTVIVEEETLNVIPNCGLKAAARNELSRHCEVLIVVGGDGSLLSASRSAAQQNLPVIGINRGALGFLTDILPDRLEKIGEIVSGSYLEERRFLLETIAYDKPADGNASNKNGQAPNIATNKITKPTKARVLGKEIALNDAVLLASSVGQMIRFTLYLDNINICNYRADGLIISTPTGSTAHALSGGGPIIHPSLDAITIVPMFSHNLSSRPIVVNAASILKIVIAPMNPTPAKIVCDGHNEINLVNGGEIIIKKAREMLHLLHPIDYDYFAALHVKLGWER
jgi:NAD+ kinase